jgi:hypothetical protein
LLFLCLTLFPAHGFEQPCLVAFRQFFFFLLALCCTAFAVGGMVAVDQTFTTEILLHLDVVVNRLAADSQGFSQQCFRCPEFHGVNDEQASRCFVGQVDGPDEDTSPKETGLGSGSNEVD